MQLATSASTVQTPFPMSWCDLQQVLTQRTKGGGGIFIEVSGPQGEEREREKNRQVDGGKRYEAEIEREKK